MDKEVVNLIRDGFQQVNNRLDQHYEMFQQHTEDDKKAWEKIEAVDREITITKRVGYVVGTAGTAVLGWLGWNK